MSNKFSTEEVFLWSVGILAGAIEVYNALEGHQPSWEHALILCVLVVLLLYVPWLGNRLQERIEELRGATKKILDLQKPQTIVFGKEKRPITSNMFKLLGCCEEGDAKSILLMPAKQYAYPRTRSAMERRGRFLQCTAWGNFGGSQVLPYCQY